jgi:hypothetical protein
MRSKLVLIVIVAAALGVASCSSPPHASAAGRSGIGHGVMLEASQTPAGARASLVSGVKPPGKRGATRLSPSYRLTPSGPLPALTTVTLPLSRLAPAGEQVLVATEETTAGPWSYLPARLTADRRAVTFQTGHFSIFTSLGVDLSVLASAFKTNFIDVVDSGISASVAQPTCEGESAARTGGFSVESTSSSAVYWCFGVSGSSRVLKVVDNRQYPLELAHPDLAVASHGVSDPLNLSSLSRVYSGGYTIVEPGGQITYNVNVPVNTIGGVSTQADLFGEDMYALQTGLTTLATILSVLGLAEVKGGVALLTTAVGSYSCAASLPQGFTAVLTSCFDAKELGEVFGSAFGVVLSAVVAYTSVVQFFRSEFDVAKDDITGKDRYYIAITHRAVQAVAPCTSAAIRAGVQAYAEQTSETLDDIQTFGCSGSFAYAYADTSVQGNENSITVLLMQQGDTWVPASRSTYCLDHEVPADIYVNACETQ